jgi:diphosphomevalonate decarboxylase
MRASARAHANIALIKYWGKSDPALNVPAVGSISITLDALWSDTDVEFDPSLGRDILSLDGKEDTAQLERVSRCLDLLRARAGVDTRARVVSRNNFPTGAGLASSASGFAALVCGGARALDLKLGPRELSLLARRGSGSAARSVFGGFVEMHRGSAPDGSDSFAQPLRTAGEWPLEVVVAITTKQSKPVSSSAGMAMSASTSPYYRAWVDDQPSDLSAARDAILARRFAALAAVAEHSCFKMHAVALSAQPAVIYWNPATMACIEAVRGLQRAGVPVFVTIDAGPQLKAVCEPEVTRRVAETLGGVPGVLDVITSGLGPGAESS